MNNVIKNNDDLTTAVKSIIFKYCPYLEDRLSILGNAKAPQIDINVNINNNESKIRFLFGNINHKQSIPEQLTIDKVIEFEEIANIIDFILADHEVIRNVYLNNNEIKLKFAINWTEKSIRGIKCDDIELNLNFNDLKLEKQYLYLLFQKYHYLLEKVPSIKRIKDEYINNIKKIYFNNLNKRELLSFLNEIEATELKELLYNLDNDIFIKYITDNKQQTKELILKRL